MTEILFKIFLILFVLGVSWSIIKVFKISLIMGILSFIIWPIPFLICLIQSFHALKGPLFLLVGSTLGISILFWIDPDLYDAYVQPLINGYHYLATP